jgi:hypothetical protein
MMLVAAVVVVSINWGEGDAAENPSEAGLADDGELLVSSFCGTKHSGSRFYQMIFSPSCICLDGVVVVSI